jgi:hypothetical protein
MKWERTSVNLLTQLISTHLQFTVYTAIISSHQSSWPWTDTIYQDGNSWAHNFQVLYQETVLILWNSDCIAVVKWICWISEKMGLKETHLKWHAYLLLCILGCLSFLRVQLVLDLFRISYVKCVWAFLWTSSMHCAEQLAKDVELFAQHAGRKSIKMEDVILTGTW